MGRGTGPMDAWLKSSMARSKSNCCEPVRKAELRKAKRVASVMMKGTMRKPTMAAALMGAEQRAGEDAVTRRLGDADPKVGAWRSRR